MTPYTLVGIPRSVKIQYYSMQTFYLLHEEGFFVGASSGLNVAAAVQVRTCCNVHSDLLYLCIANPIRNEFCKINVYKLSISSFLITVPICLLPAH